MVVLFLVFKEISILLSIAVVLMSSPSNSVRGFPFSPYPLKHLLFVDFDNGDSDQMEMILIVVLICISLIMSYVEHLFLHLLAI